MNCKRPRTANLIFTLLLTTCFDIATKAQKIQYCRENVFITNPDQLRLVANINDRHHLLHLSKDEKPTIFIYNNELELTEKVRFPFNIPDRAEVRIIPFDQFYYLCISSRYTRRYSFWKIDSEGNFKDFTEPFNRLLASQSKNVKLGFQLIPSMGNLWMVYHTALENLDKNTLVIAQADSALNVVFTHQVKYDFKRDEERLQQEILMFGRYLLVLKTARSGTTLDVMKVNLATGYTITNSFATSGYFYSQASFNYNSADTNLTVSALVTEPRQGTNARQFILVTRLNKILVESAPFVILKSAFAKNTGSNFLIVDSGSKWMRLKTERGMGHQSLSDQAMTVYEDLTMPASNNQTTTDNRMLASINAISPAKSAADPTQAIRFTLLDKTFSVVHDSLLSNVKEAFSIKADQFISFTAGDKEYLLLAQTFGRTKRGLLMVNPTSEKRLQFKNIRVNERNFYLLSKSRLIEEKGILIPYTYRNEAGLVKIIVD